MVASFLLVESGRDNWWPVRGTDSPTEFRTFRAVSGCRQGKFKVSETYDPRSLGRTSDKIEANIKLPGRRHKVKVKPWEQVKVHGFGTSCTKHHGDLRFAEERGFTKRGFASLEVSEKLHRR